MRTLEQLIAENLRLSLIKAGKTQQDLALHLGISRSKLSEVLSGRASLTVVELFAASRLFGVDIDWFAEEHLPELGVAA